MWELPSLQTLRKPAQLVMRLMKLSKLVRGGRNVFGMTKKSFDLHALGPNKCLSTAVLQTAMKWVRIPISQECLYLIDGQFLGCPAVCRPLNNREFLTPLP